MNISADKPGKQVSPDPRELQADRKGLMTSASNSRPLCKNLNQMSNKSQTSLHQLRNTFYSNKQSHGSRGPMRRVGINTLIESR